VVIAVEALNAAWDTAQQPGVADIALMDARTFMVVHRGMFWGVVLSNVHMFIVKCDAKKTVSKFATLRI
jgi:hypothetical protein